MKPTIPTTKTTSGTRRFGAASTSTRGLTAQLDFSATPRHTKGAIFPWTVFDYPLKQAILDGIVKRPMKGIAKGITEQKSDCRQHTLSGVPGGGVERWKEYRDQLTPLKRKPVCS